MNTEHPAFSLINMKALSWIKNMMELVYPPLCASCGVLRPLDYHIFCLDCLHELPETEFHRYLSNPFTDHFKGRVEIKTGAAFLFFSRMGGTQRLLHQIKYSNRPDIIQVIGRWYGKQLSQTAHWQEAQVIVPVPLHWKKFRKRGYNQSAVFGEGLGEAMNIPCNPVTLRRVTHDKSLTGMRRLERVETIGSSYKVVKPNVVKNKHVLLVDDVLTTGATLEACSVALLDAGACSVRMVTIACGEL